MNKLKKSLSVLLTLVMLFTTLCFFVLPETGIKANAAAGTAVSVGSSSYNRVDDVIITVPETIYMTPSADKSTTGQYYVNNSLDSSGKVTLDASNNAGTGKLGICAPGAVSAVYQVVDAETGVKVGDTKVSGEGTAVTLTNGHTNKTDLKLESVANGLSAGQTATIKWEITLNYGSYTVTYYAFSTLYAPWIYPVGSAVRVKGYYYSGGLVDNRYHMSESMAWVSGVHGFTNSPAANAYAKTSSYAMVPLVYGVGSADNTTKALTDWISTSSGTGTLDTATIRYSSNDGGTSDFGILSVKQSPVASLYIDTSRYTNFTQIPNLTVGFNFTNSEISGSNRANSTYWYVSDYTSKTTSSYFADYYKNDSRSNVNSSANNYYGETGATPFSGDVGTARNVLTGTEYNGTWNREVISSSDSNLYVLKTGARRYTKTLTTEGDAYSVNYVQISGVNVNKTALRNLVLQATSINRANYVNNFAHFDIDIAYAAYVLGNPAATASDVTNAIDRLNKSTNGCSAGQHPGDSTWACPGLQITVEAYQNHEALDNTILATETFVIGTNVSVDFSPATPAARAGFEFKGWNADRNATTGSSNPVKVSLYGTHKIYAIWAIKRFTMTFNTNGGSEIAPVTQDYNTQVARPADPTREGYKFAGWDITFPHTLINNAQANAKWEANQYTVTFMDGDTRIQNITQDFGTSITAPADPTKTGYEFAGWSPAVPSTMPASNVTINATWKAKSYSITYDLNTNDGIVLDAVIGESNTSYTIEDTITLPAASSTNYNFMGWEVTVNENGNWVTKVYNAGETVSDVYGNVTLRAKWNIKTYTVNWVNWNGIGIETDVVNYGEKPSFDGVTPVKPADAEFTYTFSDWDKNTKTPVTEDITFTAQFGSTTNSYTVTWNDSDGTKLTEETYLYGVTPEYPGSTPAKVDPTGRLTYIFKGWSPEITAVTGNTTYTAVYDSVVNTYTVTLTYKTADGTEKTVTLEKVDHGTSFTSLIPADCAEYISGPSNRFDHSHYVRTWTNAVDAITGPANFVADYTLVDNVTMSFADDNKNADCENDGLNSRECSFCGYAHKEVLSAKGHAWGEPVANSATCLDDGEKTYLCSRCSDTKEEFSAAHGHSFRTTVAPAVPVTCITNGSESYKTCVHCALYFAVDEDVNSKNGKADTSSFVIAAQGHKFTLTATRPATCETAGHEAYYTCSVCNLYFAENADEMTAVGTADLSTFTITKLGHDYEAVVTPPTCTVDGFTTYTCSRCDDKYTDNKVTAPGHTPGAPVYENITDATCTQSGKYLEHIYCSVCGEKISTTEHNTTRPHDYVEVIIDTLEGQCKAPKTCYSYAEYYKVCSMCRTEISTETFFDVDGGKLPHTPADKVIEDETTATCTTPSTWNEVVYCRVTACGHKISSTPVTGEKNPDNHADYGTTTTIKNEVLGTCQTERTWTEVITCNGCKEVISENNRVGSKNVLNHVNEAEGEPYIDTPGTCIAETVWRVDTRCTACNERTKTRVYKGEKNPEKHTGRTDVKLENSVAGTCIAPETWQVVTNCLDCKVELSRIDKTGNTNPNNHVAESYTQEENVVAGTCTSEKTWDVVTYCSDCEKAIGSVAHTGDKDPSNHSGVTELRNNKEATCGAEGYTGDLYWSCCDVLETEGTEIPMLSEHTPGEAVKENEIPATETSDGEYDSVVYCSVCGTELSREHVVHRIERTIRFVLKDKVVEVKAFSGDTVEAPATPEVQTEDGFWHYFISWDKKIKPVTGDATYTAIYTEPCDYSELESLEAQLKEILADGSVDDETMAANKAEIDATLEEIRRIYLDRNYRDKAEQNEITEVVDKIESLIQVICPDLGSTLVIEGSIVQYTGRTLALRAVKMPSGTEVTDAVWTSSDESIAFFANGKLYAVGTGTVTFTAQRGSLTATKSVTIVEGGDSRGINFTSVDNTSFILEDAYQAKDGAIVYWSDGQPIRFRVHVSSSFLYEKYYVYINGEAAETDMDGYYTIPANSGDVKVTIAGEMIDTGAGEGPTVTKWSFWDWLLSFFKKIGDFFRGLFS